MFTKIFHNIRQLFILVILTTLAVFPMGAAQASPMQLDVPYSKFTLKNGLTLLVHEDHKTPIIAVAVWYHVGSKNESPEKTGFAHLFEHLMFNGSEHYNDDYFKALQSAGATDINGSTNNDHTQYYQTIPTSALERTLWLESDRMGHFLGTLTQEKLNEQRDVVKNEKRERENQPYGKVWNYITQRTYPPQHPYAWPVIGSMQHLDQATLADVKQWFSDYYHPANAVIVLAGDIKPDVAREEVELYFGNIKSQPAPSRVTDWTAKMQGNMRERLYDKVPRSRLYMVWNTPGITHQDADRLDLATSILGGSKTSRLYQRLVQQEQLATSVSAYYMGREIAGQVLISIDIKPDASLEKAEAIVNEELSLFLKKGPDKEEVERAKTRLISDFIRDLEYVGGGSGKSSLLAYGQTYFNDPEYYKKSLAITEQISKSDIQDASKTWLSDGRFTLEVWPNPVTSTSTLSANRSQLPELTPAPTFHTPQFQRAQLDNGLKIIFVERKAAPLVEMALQFDAGYAADSLSKPGSAYFTMTMLKEGSSKNTSQDISTQEEQLGAHIGADNTLDTSLVSLSALSINLPDSMELFADTLLHPRFAPEDIERKRGLILATIESEKARPFQAALRTLPPLLYGKDHAYGIPFTGTGSSASIQQISQSDLINFHQTWFRPDNATLIVVGNSSLAEITELAQDYLGDWKAPSTALPVKHIATTALADKTRIFLIDRPGSTQSTLIAGHLAPPPSIENNTTVSVMNSIFGGEFTSRINMNLRENKGWAYGAGSVISNAVGQRPFFVYAPVQSDKTAESMQEIMNELNAFLNEKPATETELQTSVNNSILQLPGELESSASLLAAITELVRLKRPDNYLDAYATRLKAIDLPQLAQTSQQILKPNQLTWIVIGDRKQIEEKIRALNLGEVSVIDEP